MERICWANTDNFEQSEFVIVGIPDESKSHALRKGTEEAPFKIRHVSNLHGSFERDGKISLGRSFHGSEKKSTTLETLPDLRLKMSMTKFITLQKSCLIFVTLFYSY